MERNPPHGVTVRPSCAHFGPCAEMDDSQRRPTLNAVLQHFSATGTGMARVCEGGLALEIAGWCCKLRIYSRRWIEHFGVPVEELDEAYLSAKSP
jgi:hypothetical protein